MCACVWETGMGRCLEILEAAMIEKRKSECAKNHREVEYPNIRV